MPMNGDISLYIHLPFCTKKCPYCHFYVVLDKEPLKERLLEALLLEWKKISPCVQKHRLVSIYFGGGTPALFGPHRVQTLLEAIRNDIQIPSDVEITIEANPETCSYDDLAAYRMLGINRLSIGVQSFSNTLLHTLGRTHSSQKALEACQKARDAGFENITIDLMYELPNQTLGTWKQTLEQALTLPITHLSLYNLTIEPHTAFHRKEAVLQPQLPPQDECTAMYELAIKMMTESGFTHYEISAFCKEGLYSRHNIGYWTNRFFFGMGPSAFSYYGDRRFQNVANLPRYCKLLQEGKSTEDFEEVLDSEKRKKEVLALRLRVLEGVPRSEIDPASYASIEYLENQGLVQYKNERLCLTHKGILFYDTVASELI